MKRKNTDSELSKSAKAEEDFILNPELEGGSFFWKGGETGVNIKPSSAFADFDSLESVFFLFIFSKI